MVVGKGLLIIVAGIRKTLTKFFFRVESRTVLQEELLVNLREVRALFQLLI